MNMSSSRLTPHNDKYSPSCSPPIRRVNNRHGECKHPIKMAETSQINYYHFRRWAICFIVCVAINLYIWAFSRNAAESATDGEGKKSSRKKREENMKTTFVSIIASKAEELIIWPFVTFQFDCDGGSCSPSRRHGQHQPLTHHGRRSQRQCSQSILFARRFIDRNEDNWISSSSDLALFILLMSALLGFSLVLPESSAPTISENVSLDWWRSIWLNDSGDVDDTDTNEIDSEYVNAFWMIIITGMEMATEAVCSANSTRFDSIRLDSPVCLSSNLSPFNI